MVISPAHNGHPPRIILQCESVVVRIEPEQEEAGKREYHIALFFPHLSQQQEEVLKKLIETRVMV